VSGPLKDTDLYPYRNEGQPGSNSPFKLINYIITDCLGNKKYMSALVYNEVVVKMNEQGVPLLKVVCPKSLILVSLFPMFQF